MLTELFIKNFAIIDDLHIRFSGGLTIITGETGAGKSIIIQAFNLILGDRATAKMIRSGEDAAELEALFDILPESSLYRRIKSAGYDPSEGLLIKRVISQNDRHRIYINGHIATVQVLSSITEHIANISGQFASQSLLKEDQQLEALDQFGGAIQWRQAVAQNYHEILPLIEQLQRLEEKQKSQAERIDLLRFQQAEISAARITPGEDVVLEQEKLRLKNAASLYQAVYEGIESLYGAPGAVIERLTEVQRGLESSCRIDPSLRTRIQGIAEAGLRLEDSVASLREYLREIQMDEGRLEEVESRLDILHKLKRKYGPDIESVLSRLDAMEKELGLIEDIPQEIKRCRHQIEKTHDTLAAAAKTLSEKRIHSGQALSKAMEKELFSLKMQKTRFDVFISRNPEGNKINPYLKTDGAEIQETGIDRVTFMIAPNVGEKLKPLAQIASGGELSRVVLALKALMARTDSVETLVFDEVDAGIGGGVAAVVGKKLSTLSRYHQVICITHLPQIAVCGDRQFKIEKTVSKGRTRTAIIPLEGEDRIQEIARMLGGETITPTTLEHAREMMKKGGKA